MVDQGMYFKKSRNFLVCCRIQFPNHAKANKLAVLFATVALSYATYQTMAAFFSWDTVLPNFVVKRPVKIL